MSKAKIKEAIRSLDPANDDDWTPAGLPSIEAVSEIYGGDTKLTRAEISDADPGFDRDGARGGSFGETQGEGVRMGRRHASGHPVTADGTFEGSGGSERSAPQDMDPDNMPDPTESTAAQEARAAAAVKQGLAGRTSAGDSRPFDLLDEFVAVTSAPEYRRNQIFQQIRTLWSQAQKEARAFQAKHDLRTEDRNARRERNRERSRELADAE